MADDAAAYGVEVHKAFDPPQVTGRALPEALRRMTQQSEEVSLYLARSTVGPAGGQASLPRAVVLAERASAT